MNNVGNAFVEQLYAYHRQDPVNAVHSYRKAADAGLVGVGKHLARLAPLLSE